MIPPIVQPGNVFQRIRMPDSAGASGQALRVESVSGELAQLGWVSSFLPSAHVHPLSDLAGLGTGVAAALAIAIGSVGGPVVKGGDIGAATGTSLNLTGNIQLAAPGKIEVLSGSSGTVYMQGGDFQYNNFSFNQRKMMLGNNAAGLLLDSSTMSIRWSASTDVYTSPRTGISENGAGIVSVDTTTRNNALGTVACAQVNLAGADVTTNSILTSASGGILFARAGNGSWIYPGDGRYQMRSDGFIGWTSSSNPVAGLDTTHSRQSAGVHQFGTTGNNALGSIAAASATLSTALNANTINPYSGQTVTINTGTGYALKWDNNGLYSNGFAQPLGTVTNPWGSINAGSAIFSGNVTTGNQCTFGTSTGRGYYNTSFGLQLPSNLVVGFSSNVDGGAAAYDTNVSRQAPGVVQIGTTSANALGSLACANVTASGTVTGTSVVLGAGTTASPSIRFGADTNSGICQVTGNSLSLVVSGSELIRTSTGSQVYYFANLHTFYGNIQVGSANDANFSRQSSGVVQIGNSTSANALGSLACANVTASGLSVTGTAAAQTIQCLAPAGLAPGLLFTENTIGHRAWVGYQAGGTTLQYRAGGYNAATGTTVATIAANGSVWASTQFSLGSNADYITASSNLGYLGITSNQGTVVYGTAAAKTVFKVIGTASQTSPLIEAQNSALATVFSVNNSGILSATGGIRTMSTGLLLALDGSFNSGVYLQSLTNGKLRAVNYAGTAGVQFDLNTADTLIVRNITDTAAGNLTVGNITASGTVTSTFQSLTADPTTLDLSAGQMRAVKNTTSGVLSLFANDGGTIKKVALT